MEKYEKPCMEVVEIEEDLTTGLPGCALENSCRPVDGGLCGIDAGIGHS